MQQTKNGFVWHAKISDKQYLYPLPLCLEFLIALRFCSLLKNTAHRKGILSLEVHDLKTKGHYVEMMLSREVAVAVISRAELELLRVSLKTTADDTGDFDNHGVGFPQGLIWKEDKQNCWFKYKYDLCNGRISILKMWIFLLTQWNCWWV